VASLDRVTEPWTRGETHLDGARIFFVEAGQGEPVLLLHGYPQSHLCWRDQIDALAQSHRVVAPDWLGWGEPERRLEFPRCARSSPPDSAASTVRRWSYGASEELAARIPGAQLARIAGADHDVVEERPHEVRQALLRLLATPAA
jgi:pimeloyl-ACP methyl ester carboxylesterase